MMNWQSTNTQVRSQVQNTPQQTQPYCVTHDFDGPKKLSTTLVHAISEATNVDVTDAEKTLCHQVDPHALDMLFKPMGDESPRAHGHLSIRVWGHDVTIFGDGRILISPHPSH
jgi:hypothetical protein